MKRAISHATLVLVAVFGITITNCIQITGPEPTVGANQIENVGSSDNSNNGQDHSRRTDLALMRTLQTHQVGVPELSQIVLNAFNEAMAAPTAARPATTASGITRSRAVHSNTTNTFERSERFSISRHENQGNTGRLGRGTATRETETVELHEFVLDDNSGGEWFVLASNDVRVGHILAITQGSFESSDSRLATFLRESLNEYIDAIIHEYNNITDDEAETTLAASFAAGRSGMGMAKGVGPGVPEDPNNWVLVGYTSNLQVQRGPLLQTQWGQGSWGYFDNGFAYNNFIKYVFGNEYYRAGCGPVAIAQIVAYHNFINPSLLSRMRMAPPFTDATSSTMNMGTWNGQYNLSLIRTMPFIFNTASADAKGQVAALMFHIFREVDAAPAYNDNGAYTATTSFLHTKAPAFRRLGYVIEHEGAATTLSGTSSNFSIQYHTGLDVIRNAINNNRPIFAAGWPTEGVGHFWVIDGHGSITWIEEHYRHRTTGDTLTRVLALNNILMVHCNMGWNGNNRGYYNGWYMYGIFDASANRDYLQQDIKTGDLNYSTWTRLIIPRRP